MGPNIEATNTYIETAALVRNQIPYVESGLYSSFNNHISVQINPELLKNAPSEGFGEKFNDSLAIVLQSYSIFVDLEKKYPYVPVVSTPIYPGTVRDTVARTLNTINTEVVVPSAQFERPMPTNEPDIAMYLSNDESGIIVVRNHLVPGIEIRIKHDDAKHADIVNARNDIDLQTLALTVMYMIEIEHKVPGLGTRIFAGSRLSEFINEFPDAESFAAFMNSEIEKGLEEERKRRIIEEVINGFNPVKFRNKIDPQKIEDLHKSSL